MTSNYLREDKILFDINKEHISLALENESDAARWVWRIDNRMPSEDND